MKQWHRLWLGAGALALASSSVSAHTAKICWRIEPNGSVTMFAGTYHDVPGIFGGVIIDGSEYAFTDSTPALPEGDMRCQADCAPSPPIVKWQIANVTIPSGLHLLETTDTTENETPWPGCYPIHFGTGGPIATTLYYTGGTSSDQGVEVTVGTIMDPVILGAMVVFRLDGGESCIAFADWNGIASCTITPTRTPGDYPLTATYLGDGTVAPTAKTITFSVTGEAPPPPPPTPKATSISYTGHTHLANAKAAQLSGVLRDSDQAPVAGRAVSFTLGAGASAQSCSGTTDAGGAASCNIASVSQSTTAGVIGISASFAGDAAYLASSIGAEASLQYMAGEAYALGGQMKLWFGTLTLPRTPDTGLSLSSQGGTTTVPCKPSLSGKLHGVELLGAQQLCASVTTNAALGTSKAQASIGSVTIGSGGLLPAIKFNNITAISQSSCSANASAQVTVGSFQFGGLTIPIGPLTPNMKLTLPFGGKITFNEQLPTADSKGMTVNAVHVVLPPALGFGGLDFVVASAKSGVHDCRTLTGYIGDAAGLPEVEEPGDEDELGEEGGCQSGRPVGALGLVAVALVGIRRRRRRS